MSISSGVFVALVYFVLGWEMGGGWLRLLVKRKDFFGNQNNDNDHSTIFLSLKSVTINCYTSDHASGKRVLSRL